MTCQQRPEICVLLRRGAMRKSLGVAAVTVFMMLLTIVNVHVTQTNCQHYLHYDGQSQNFSRFLNPLSWIITTNEASEQRDSHFQDGGVSEKSIELQGTQHNTSQLRKVDEEKLMVMMPRRAVIKYPGFYAKDQLQKVNWVSNRELCTYSSFQAIYFLFVFLFSLTCGPSNSGIQYILSGGIHK